MIYICFLRTSARHLHNLTSKPESFLSTNSFISLHPMPYSTAPFLRVTAR